MQKKQNKSLSKFLDFKKFTLIIPAILLAVAMLIYAIWGFNRGYEYKESETYNIHFNTTVSSKNFKTYKDIICDTFSDESSNDFVVKVTRVNDDMTSACKVNVYNNTNLSEEEFVEKIDSINVIIETKLNQLDETTSVRITNVKHQNGDTYGNILLKGSLAVFIFMLVAFIYFLIRFELKTALSSLIIAPFTYIVMLSFMVIFRIPFTASFMLPVLFSEIIGYIMFTLLFDNIRQSLENKENNLTNDDLVYGSIKSNMSTLITLISALSIIFVLLTFLFNVNTLLMCLSLLFALVVAVYSAVICTGSVWSMIYNRQNDKRLKARIKILEARENKKNSKSSKKQDTENNAVV